MNAGGTSGCGGSEGEFHFVERDRREAGEARFTTGAKKAGELELRAGITDLDGEDAATEGADACRREDIGGDAAFFQESLPRDADADEAALHGADEACLLIDLPGEPQVARRRDSRGAGALKADDSRVVVEVGGGVRCRTRFGRGLRDIGTP